MINSFKNPFVCLDIVPSYDIDPAELDQKYYARMRDVHPDQQTNLASVTLSTEMNQAYQALKDPLKRADALLQFQNITPLDHLDPIFLAEMMDFQELLLEGVQACIENTFATLQMRWSAMEQDFQSAFETHDIEKQRMLLAQMGYIYKLRAQFEKKQKVFYVAPTA